MIEYQKKDNQKHESAFYKLDDIGKVFLQENYSVGRTQTWKTLTSREFVVSWSIRSFMYYIRGYHCVTQD